MFSKTITTAALTLISFTATPCRADPCSVSDQALIAARVQRAVDALASGDLAKYVELLRAPDPGLSPTCRTAQEQLNPASTRCTSVEKKLILSQYTIAMRAAFAGDVPGMLDALSNVYDHGGGTYSVPGVGACTPSGCMAF
jgi:hypothetical protein